MKTHQLLQKIEKESRIFEWLLAEARWNWEQEALSCAYWRVLAGRYRQALKELHW